MKKIFAFYNGCYWMMFSTFEEAQKMAHKFTYFNEEYFKEVFAKEKFLFVNSNGGYHGGHIDEKKDFIVCEDFPTPKQRVEYLKARVEVEIDCACADLGMTRQEVLDY